MLRGLLMRYLIFAMILTWLMLVQDYGIRFDLILRDEGVLLDDWLSIVPRLLFNRCRPWWVLLVHLISRFHISWLRL